MIISVALEGGIHISPVEERRDAVMPRPSSRPTCSRRRRRPRPRRTRHASRLALRHEEALLAEDDVVHENARHLVGVLIGHDGGHLEDLDGGVLLDADMVPTGAALLPMRRRPAPRTRFWVEESILRERKNCRAERPIHTIRCASIVKVRTPGPSFHIVRQRKMCPNRENKRMIY